MKKIVTVLLTFLFLTSCGYTPMYSQKNFDFKLKNITSTKSDRLNSKVQKRLLSFSNQESQQVFSLKVNTLRKINVLTKNSKGDPSRYEMIIDVKLEAANGQNLNKSQSFQERFNYNANANKFELKQFEKEIEDLLIDKTIDLIIIYLSKI
jgi:hypothetical protein